MRAPLIAVSGSLYILISDHVSFSFLAGFLPFLSSMSCMRLRNCPEESVDSRSGLTAYSRKPVRRVSQQDYAN